jgi:glyoxylase-like metal-dependent hydrolase (beta-lactamase superfamily II)
MARVVPFLVSELCLPRATPIEEALAAHGISLADLTGAANCHLHFDHAGQNARPTPAGTVILAGQAVRSRAEWEGSTEPSTSGPSAPDPDAYGRSVERLRALEPVRVHFAHDPDVWER